MDQETRDQEEVFAFLADPASHGGNAVKRIPTHAAIVFLAGKRVLKVKRAVRFPFLDYSTLEKRKAACQAEIEVNRSYAPELYLRALPITREEGGSLALGGKGEPVEWAVEMRRFDENLTLDRIAEERGIDLDIADTLAREIAAAHERAAVVDPAPWIASLPAFFDEHAAAFRERPDLFPANDVAALDRACRVAFARVRPLLQKRGEHGLVRHCHGDLHLGNVALIGGRPVLFDAIEFNPLIASTDVLYDLAFLLMDLIERELIGPANIVLNRYLTETRRDENLDGLAALPLFLSLRASIRAKVTAVRLDQAKQEKWPQIMRSARAYFAAACRLIQPSPPRLIAIGGLSGTGKSVLARALAAEITPLPGAVLLRSDVVRKTIHGAAETEKLPREAYSASATAGVYDALAGTARRVVAAGHSAIVDAVFAREDERAAIAAVAQACGVGFHGLFLTADLDTRSNRVARRRHDASDADAELTRLQENYDLGALAWPSVDATGTPDATLALAQAALA